jgi:OPA family glycerol-3-phosphate transporter-like MFS transporter 1/2
VHVSSEDAAYFSILFDVGGIVGGVLAGMATDYTGKSASTCAVMLITAIPAVSIRTFCKKFFL